MLIDPWDAHVTAVSRRDVVNKHQKAHDYFHDSVPILEPKCSHQHSRCNSPLCPGASGFGWYVAVVSVMEIITICFIPGLYLMGFSFQVVGTGHYLTQALSLQ